MEYRDIGRTGMQASVIGLGCEHLDQKPYETVKETVDTALAGGVNILDLFMPGAEVRQNIGRALGARRQQVLIQGHIGSVDLSQQYDISRDLPTCQRYFEDLLRHLGTDYIDFGMLFFIDSDKALDTVLHGGILDYAKRLKQNGTIRAIGASSHNPLVAAKLVESGEVDLLLFSINPAFDRTPGSQDVLEKLDGSFASTQLAGTDPARARLYQLCQRQGVAITVMKTLGAGKLLTAEMSPFGTALSVGQCIHYALTRPAVVSALVGCASAAQMDEALAYLNLSDAERDYAPALGGFDTGKTAGCVYCNHCLPCPAGIDIAAVHRLLDVAELAPEDIPQDTRARYAALGKTASECIFCGHCEGRCPFGVAAMQNMKRAAALFGR